jgi:hypothetical protein
MLVVDRRPFSSEKKKELEKEYPHIWQREGE